MFVWGLVCLLTGVWGGGQHDVAHHDELGTTPDAEYMVRSSSRLVPGASHNIDEVCSSITFATSESLILVVKSNTSLSWHIGQTVVGTTAGSNCWAAHYLPSEYRVSHQSIVFAGFVTRVSGETYELRPVTRVQSLIQSTSTHIAINCENQHCFPSM
jgi:hypothetical protein